MPDCYCINIKNGKTGTLTNAQTQQRLPASRELDLLQFNFLITHGNTEFVNAGKLIHVDVPNDLRYGRGGRGGDGLSHRKVGGAIT
jgi:hypothetical protein